MSEVNYTTQSVDASRWSEMSVNELIEQRNRMFDRYDFMTSKKQNVTAIIDGINSLDRHILFKNNI